MATTLETCAAFEVRQKRGLTTEQVQAQAPQRAKKRLQRSTQKSPRLPLQFWLLLACMFFVSISVFILDTSAAVLGFTATSIVLFFFGLAQQSYVRHGLLVLAKQPPRYSTVRRDGHEQSIPVAQVLPGDIILLMEGDYIPADIRLTQVNKLTVSQDYITGEILPVTKNTFTLHAKTPLDKQKNMGFAGTYVASGTAEGIVVGEPADRQLLHAIKKLSLTKPQEKKRIMAACIAGLIGATLLFFSVTIVAVIGLSALLALAAYYYVTFWIQYVSWVSLYEQCLAGGVRFKTFTALQKIAKVDYAIINMQQEVQELAVFVHRLQAELRIEVRPTALKNSVKDYEHALNISGSALSKQVFMNATRDKKLKLLREYQFLIGFDTVALNESISLLQQAGHSVLWVDDAKSPQPESGTANVYISQQAQPSNALLSAADAAYTRAPSLKRLAGLFDALDSFNRITKY
jgi:hypothetical protein